MVDIGLRHLLLKACSFAVCKQQKVRENAVCKQQMIILYLIILRYRNIWKLFCKTRPFVVIDID